MRTSFNRRAAAGRARRAARFAPLAFALVAGGAAAADGTSGVLVRMNATVVPVMCNGPARNPLPACAAPTVSETTSPLRYAAPAPGGSSTATTFEVRVDAGRQVVVRTLLY